MKEQKIFFIDKKTACDCFKSTLEEAITLLVKLKTSIDIEVAV